MRLPLKVLLVLLGASCLGACSQPPNPVIARDPLPAPAYGVKVECDTYRAPFWSAYTDCRPAAVKQRTIVRAKG